MTGDHPQQNSPTGSYRWSTMWALIGTLLYINNTSSSVSATIDSVAIG
jgi:hypothetical protein